MIYIFNGYNGNLKNYPDYVLNYKKEEVKRTLATRYIANAIGGRFGVKKSYDDMMKELDEIFDYNNIIDMLRGYNKKYKRTSKEIKEDLIRKFNKKEQG